MKTNFKFVNIAGNAFHNVTNQLVIDEYDMDELQPGCAGVYK